MSGVDEDLREAIHEHLHGAGIVIETGQKVSEVSALTTIRPRRPHR